MSRRTGAVLTSLALAAGLCGAFALGGVLKSQTIHAQAAEARRVRFQQWEYCSVFVGARDLSDGRETGSAVIYYMNDERVEAMKVEAAANANAKEVIPVERRALSKAVAKLGREGWELVSEGDLTHNSGGKSLFFKRPGP